jgi:DNA-binding MarR family transcriptional regulator
MNERGSLIDEIGRLEIQLLASALPQETSSLLDYDLTLQQIRVFAHVFASQPTPITRLADMLDIRPNVATGIVQRLVERGLLGRREDPSDRRVRLLTVTEKGQALIDELGRIILGKEPGLLDRLSDQQLCQLRDLLTVMAAPQSCA